MSKSIILFCSLFILTTANAYPSASVESLVGEVLEKNPEIRFYQAEIDAAKGMHTTAGIWANPEVGGSIGQKKVWNEDGELTGKGSTFDLSLTQSIEWPGRLGLRKAIAQRDIELAELGLQHFRALLKGRAQSALYNLYAARQKESATREVSEHFRSLKEVLSQRSPAGLTPLLESRVIEAMELNMQRKATEAALTAQSALSDWNLLRGKPAEEDFQLEPVTLKFKPLEKDATSLSSLAQSNDYAIRRQAIGLERQKFQVGLAENERMPSVSVGPVISQERSGDKERVVGGAVSLPFPLWNSNQGNIDTEKARRAQSEVSLDLAKRETEGQVARAILAYERKLKEISAWKPEAIQHFKEAAELADRHYRLGSVPVTVYVELQTQYLEALEGLHATRKEALETAKELEIITGADLGLVNMDFETK